MFICCLFKPIKLLGFYSICILIWPPAPLPPLNQSLPSLSNYWVKATLPFYSYFDLHSVLILCDAKIKILMPLPLSLNCFHIAEEIGFKKENLNFTDN